MIMQTKWYWFSFSHNGENQGCCNVQAENKEAALRKTIELGIHPKHDDIECFHIAEPELEADRLYSKAELEAKDYESIRDPDKL